MNPRGPTDLSSRTGTCFFLLSTATLQAWEPCGPVPSMDWGLRLITPLLDYGDHASIRHLPENQSKSNHKQ